MDFAFVKFEVFLPEQSMEEIRNALNEIGALTVGNYDHVISYYPVTGSWRPMEGSNPFDGSVGEICTGSEYKLEFRCPYEKAVEAKRIIEDIHPYEEPIINIMPLLYMRG
ncbi:MAG: cytochrome C biogenesis protein [Coriobacteriia bacterium]|nr:cytochrome C biogenesis protein [Coriobacteriia bacterium]